jgi:biotin carboxyl carrier protein
MKYHVAVGGADFVVEFDAGMDGETARVTGAGSAVRVVITPLRDGGGEVMAGAPEIARRAAVSLLARDAAGSTLRLLVDDHEAEARVETERDRLRASAQAPAAAASAALIRSALPGVIRRILLGPGAAVEAGTPILTLEAMKMENEVRAEAPGRIRAVLVEEGQVVEGGDPLVEVG